MMLGLSSLAKDYLTPDEYTGLQNLFVRGSGGRLGTDDEIWGMYLAGALGYMHPGAVPTASSALTPTLIAGPATPSQTQLWNNGMPVLMTGCPNPSDFVANPTGAVLGPDGHTFGKCISPNTEGFIAPGVLSMIGQASPPATDWNQAVANLKALFAAHPDSLAQVVNYVSSYGVNGVLFVGYPGPVWLRFVTDGSYTVMPKGYDPLHPLSSTTDTGSTNGTTMSTSLISGIPDTYLMIGAGALVLLLALRR